MLNCSLEIIWEGVDWIHLAQRLRIGSSGGFSWTR